VPLSLNGPRAKHVRAHACYDILCREIESVESARPYNIRCEVDEQVGRYDFYVNGLTSTDAVWGLQIGDIVHNLRCALDHLAVLLVALCTQQDPATIDFVQFPICESPDRFKDWLSRLRADAKKRHLDEPLLLGYRTRLEELQPYSAWDPSIWGSENTGFVTLASSLQRIADLDNIDKHRVIHATWYGVKPFISPDKHVVFPDGFTFTGAGTCPDPQAEDTKVGSWTFAVPLPTSWIPEQGDMKACFPLQVCIEDPSIVHGVRHILCDCLFAVQGVLDIFDPVFVEYGVKIDPPLPLTSLLVTHSRRTPNAEFR
jgi:hypothetical protein